ncbi:cell envelope integrity protein TolA [Acinetobacter sp.]|uniref:cell envelope integrity protein TolA n=1 Tax=Acinetobacter sp. TaxID=472 RepID=UPI0035B4B35D
MKTFFLFSTLVLLGTQTFAENRSIYLPSSALPDHVSANQFNALLKENEPQSTLGTPVQNIQMPPKAISHAPSKLLDEEAAKRKAESKEIALSAKKDFANKIRRAWHVPLGSAGKSATAHITLADNGSVRSIHIESNDLDMKNSIATAIRAAAPFPMPSNPEARKQVKSFTSSFWSK